MKPPQTLLNRYPAGSIGAGKDVEDVLASHWHLLDGSGDGGMDGYKRKGRMESIEWAPPHLHFKIERHGPTDMGSVYAGLQHWTVNVDTGRADLHGETRRQVLAKDRPLKAEPLAEHLAAAILQHADDPWLKWDGRNRVKILIGHVIPATNKQTTTARRKRLWKAFEEKVGPFGWARPSARSHFFNCTANPPVAAATLKQLQETAYHEAAHVVANILHNIGVGSKGVSIIPDEESYGRAYSRKGFTGNPEHEITPAMRHGAERRVVAMFVGAIAQRRFSPSSVEEYHDEGDRQSAVELMTYFEGSERQLQAKIDYLYICAEDLVACPPAWTMIEAVAAALLEKKHLTSHEVKAICVACANFQSDGFGKREDAP